MLGSDEINNNSIVILSDDDDDEEDLVINNNGKRTYGATEEATAIQSDMDDDDEDEEEGDGKSRPADENDMNEEYDSLEDDDDDDDEEEDSDEEGGPGNYVMKKYMLSQYLPEDHESPIFSERGQENKLVEINNILSEFIAKFLDLDPEIQEIETSFSYGGLLKEDVPNVAMNLKGMPFPFAFPLNERDIERILGYYHGNSSTTENATRLDLSTADLIINESFQEFLHQKFVIDLVRRLGVEKPVADSTRMVGHKLHILSPGERLQLSEIMSSNSNAYGTVVIILPTEYSGGEITIKYNHPHGNDYEPDTAAPRDYFYVGWYNNTETLSLPVTEGHQVAISFSLNCDNSALDSSPEYLQKRRKEVSEGVLCEKDEKESKPYIDCVISYLKSRADMESPIFYMLQYYYPYSSLYLEQLNTADRTLARELKKAAAMTGFDVYLASVDRDVEATTQASDKDTGCPMDEEGILLSQDIITDEIVITGLFDEDGKDILKAPLVLNAMECSPIIQGNAWFARCKPEAEVDKNKTQETPATVKYYYTDATALFFLPKDKLSMFLEKAKYDYEYQ